jgi:hypothetical protein
LGAPPVSSSDSESVSENEENTTWNTVYTSETFESYSIEYSLRDGTITSIEVFSDSRTSDNNVQEVVYPENHGWGDYAGTIVFDFEGSGKSIEYVSISRFNGSRSDDSSYSYDSSTPALFPYEDSFVFTRRATITTEFANRFSFEFIFTDGTSFTGVFTLIGLLPEWIHVLTLTNLILFFFF